MDKVTAAMKKRYEKSKFEFIEVKKEDIITLSLNGDGDYIEDNGGFDTPEDPFTAE